MLLKRVIFHVTKTNEGMWRVAQKGRASLEHLYETRQRAIMEGKALAREQEGKLVIHDEQGAIQRECIYGYACWRPPREA